MIRFNIHSIDSVLSLVDLKPFFKKRPRVNIGNSEQLVHLDSQRLQLFKLKGIKCVVCGIEGSFFAEETHIEGNHPHLNLYAVNENGEDVLMTKDHIIPKSKGGKDWISNYQVMCYLCNITKGNKL